MGYPWCASVNRESRDTRWWYEFCCKRRCCPQKPTTGQSGPYSLLTAYLTSLTDEYGQPLCEVTARDRHPDADGNDPILSHLDRNQFDELWLFALDVGDGLSQKDCDGGWGRHP